MFDRWQALLQWLDSPASDWLWNAIEDEAISRPEVEDILLDYDLPLSDFPKLVDYLLADERLAA
jgi:hypothetical protein